MGQKGSWLQRRLWRCCCRKGSATPFGFRLTPAPDGDRTEEVRVAQQILQSLEIRRFFATGFRLSGLRADHVPPCFKRSRTRSKPISGPECRRGRIAFRRGRIEGCRDGMRGQWAGRIQARKYRHFSSGTGEDPKAPVYVDGRLKTILRGRQPHPGIYLHPRGLCCLALPCSSGEGFAIIRVSV